MYHIKEAFYTLQGEGARTGRASVFCRFTGCNLWSGRESDRQHSACRFCDTDFVGSNGKNGGRFADTDTLAAHLAALWPHLPTAATPYVVFTGGEPLLQLDTPLIEAMQARGFEVAVETNGTLPAPPGIDWLCVSPKGTTTLAIENGDELKLVYPQHDAPPSRFASLDFSHFFLQPMDTTGIASCGQPTTPLDAALAYCLANPQWRLSLQIHKTLGIE
ncbi:MULTISPECIES: 7-carboxy-7-deazaguanine synthase [Halomonadaceae]|mgnify:CR=1 FL=1|uniref:7-carboxy-7-deazaguanine synthase n=1 Tax=Modicisalibacter zincidurans TaxID=1178777 RepID=A0ABP9QXA2_9GAMM|nr:MULTISPECIES: 7-carboxy-7-deazaguanine synthase [Halomonas]MCD6008887.1 7-carboxy-7-deazaguanine synthase [Halomonas sp. IOP_31]